MAEGEAFKDNLAFNVILPLFQGSLGELAHALRTDKLKPQDVDVLELVKHYLSYFNQWVDADLNLASEALPLLARVIELKTRFLLPRPPKDDEEEAVLEETLEAVTLLEELEDAIHFLKHKREERRLILTAKTPRPDYPRPERALKVGLGRLAELASKYRVSSYFEMAIERLTMAGAMKQLLSTLKQWRKGWFKDLIAHQTWEVASISFAGLMELYKERRVHAEQAEVYGPIELEWLEQSAKQQDAA